MNALDEKACRVLHHEQRTNHADVAVKPGGLALFFQRWVVDARNARHPHADRLQSLFIDYASLDPMQRTARVRAALSLLDTQQPTTEQTQQSVQSTAATQSGISPSSPQSRQVAGTPPTVDHQPHQHDRHPGQKTEPASPLQPLSVEEVTYLLQRPLSVMPGFGPASIKKFERIGIFTLEDLLYYLPREHLDYTTMLSINQLPFEQMVTIRGYIWEIENVKSAKSTMVRTIARVTDETGQLRAVWFNQPYLQKILAPGSEIVLTGTKQRFGNAVQFTVKSYELPDKGDVLSLGRIIPIYPLTEGISEKILRKATKWAIDRCGVMVPDYLPSSVVASANILPLAAALSQYHYPDSAELLAAARHRLAFDEMFVLQLGMFSRRGKWVDGETAPRIHINRARIFADISEDGEEEPAPIPDTTSLWGATLETGRCFESSLPFRFTPAQVRVINEVLADMDSRHPMCRLIQGDVGSGKTAVAAAALYAAALRGYQGVLMAPTEILAEQHARSLTKMFEPFGIQVAILTGSQKTKQRADVLAAVETGAARIIVGTHALIQENVTFARLGLAIVDEQHRFGVAQREILRRKGGEMTPHLLVMTATPIPRTLALTLYGDLDVSVIDQMPKGRLPIITRWRSGMRAEEAYQQMAWEVMQGHQGFIICPLIEESENLEVKAAVVEYERLRTTVFPHLRLGLVHGALRPAEKDATMSTFHTGEIDILVATAVVEVGVDVPNATMMIIEDADRFGLAQLHQFRGRVGRGNDQAYCYVLSQDAGAVSRERLSIIERTTDGFMLAEADLRLRGPGEFFGTRQSGIPELRVAELTDAPLIGKARKEAEIIWTRDPFLRAPEHRALRERVEHFWQNYMPQ